MYGTVNQVSLIAIIVFFVIALKSTFQGEMSYKNLQISRNPLIHPTYELLSLKIRIFCTFLDQTITINNLLGYTLVTNPAH